jgi:putative peptidoglycan lipid II flippase
VPATVGLIVLATPIVRVIFERAAFTPADTAATAAAVQFYALGLGGYSIVRIVSPVFYALGQNRTPVMVSIATVLTNALLNIALVRVLGYMGLALGTSIAALFNAGLLMIFLRRRLAGIEGGRVTASLVRIVIASALMGGAALGVERTAAAWMPGTGLLVQIIRLSTTIAAAVGVLAAAAYALRIREFHEGMALLTRRFRMTGR